MDRKFESPNALNSITEEHHKEKMINKAVKLVIREAISQKAFPGAVVCYGQNNNFWSIEEGRLTYDKESPKVNSEVIYDLASLTKIFSTTAILVLATNHILDLDHPIDKYLEGDLFPGVTIRHVLSHTGGLTLSLSNLKNLSPKEIDHAICFTSPEFKPGRQIYYSNQGYYILGKIIEAVTNNSLKYAFKKILFEPLGLQNTLSNPSSLAKDRIAPTEYDLWRGRQICGEVHDEIAFKMGGLCGHAGLFSTAGDLYKLGRLWLGEGAIDNKRIITPELIGQSVINNFPDASNIAENNPQNFALGWRLKNIKFTGDNVSDRTYDFFGFTGPSLMVDPERKVIIAIVENRIFPSRSNPVQRSIYHSRITDEIYKGMFP